MTPTPLHAGWTLHDEFLDIIELRLHDATQVADEHLVLAVPDRQGTQLSLVRVKVIDAHLDERRFAPPVLHQEGVADDAHDHHRMFALVEPTWRLL
eukprot:scaffold78302_cov48-Phaeocystis_antarctica.AAC.3